MLFIVAQAIGIVAWVLYLYSFYKEDTDKILVVQIIASILYCFNYGLLGAWSGLFTTILEICRDFGYYKTDKDNIIFLCSIPVYIIIGIATGNGFISLLPIIASLIDGFSLTKHRNIVVAGGLLSNILWIIYEITFKSYTVAITDSLIVISNFSILLLGYSRFLKSSKFSISNSKNMSMRIFKEIYKLDTNNLDKELLWDIPYQRNLYNLNKDSFILIKDNEKVIGYINYLNVTKEIYDKYLESSDKMYKYKDSDILKFKKNENNYIIIDSIVINKNYDNYKTIKMYRDGFNRMIRRLIKNGIIIGGVCCKTDTAYEEKVLEECSFVKENDNLYVYFEKYIRLSR